MTSPTIQDIGQIVITVKDALVSKKFNAEVLGVERLFDAGPNLSFVARAHFV